MFAFDITADSRVGCVRENNEDLLLMGSEFVRNGSLHLHQSTESIDRYLFALADGMGGHSSGEVASSDVLHNLQFFYSDIPAGLTPGDFNEMIYEWLVSINHIIDSKGHSSPVFREMGTTLVAFAYYNGEYYWLNCGDSRLYRLHNGQLTQMTTDHSLSNLLGEKDHSSIITNCIGGGCKNSYIDIVKCTENIQAGDTFLLCSDGLSDMINDDDIKQLLSKGADATMLCEEAEKAGGYDNVSAIVIKVVDR
jgi:protein phosphatase